MQVETSVIRHFSSSLFICKICHFITNQNLKSFLNKLKALGRKIEFRQLFLSREINKRIDEGGLDKYYSILYKYYAGV